MPNGLAAAAGGLLPMLKLVQADADAGVDAGVDAAAIFKPVDVGLCSTSAGWPKENPVGLKLEPKPELLPKSKPSGDLAADPSKLDVSKLDPSKLPTFSLSSTVMMPRTRFAVSVGYPILAV